MRVITAQIVALLVIMSLGEGCGKEEVHGRLTIQFSGMCDPTLAELEDAVASYCILVEHLNGDLVDDNCQSSIDQVELKVDALSVPVRVVVEGRNAAGTLVARGRSVPVTLISGEDMTLQIPIVSALEFGLVAADRAGCDPLQFPAVGHSATVFPSGHVLVTGSRHSDVPSSRAAFLVDPMTGAMDDISTPSSLHRSDHSATLLQDGRVVVIGGLTPGGIVVEKSVMLRGADTLMEDYDRGVYYPGKVFFDELRFGPISPRGVHDAARFHGDRVLLNDGESTAELFVGFTERSDFIQIVGDPTNNPFPAHTGRVVTVVPLDQERAVILGGDLNHNGVIIVSDERLEVTFLPFNLESGMRDHPKGLLLPSKQAMFIGGGNGALVLRQPVIVIDPTVPELAVVPVPEGAFPIHSFTASVLPDGRVVVTGGEREGAGSQFQPGSTFIIDPRGEDPADWAVLGGPRLKMPRAGHSASVLPDGRLLIVGGYSADPEVSHEAVALSAEVIAF